MFKRTLKAKPKSLKCANSVEHATGRVSDRLNLKKIKELVGLHKEENHLNEQNGIHSCPVFATRVIPRI